MKARTAFCVLTNGEAQIYLEKSRARRSCLAPNRSVESEDEDRIVFIERLIQEGSALRKEDHQA